MNKKEIITYKSCLIDYFSLIQRVSLVLLILSVGGYSFALLLLYKKMTVLSLIFATIVFISFWISKKYVPMVARWWLHRKLECEEMLTFIDKERKERDEFTFLALLKKAVDVS